MVITKQYSEPEINRKEILRYAGVKMGPKDARCDLAYVNELMEECIKEVCPRLTYKVCSIQLPLEIKQEVCDFQCFQVCSKDLAKSLEGCKEAILFAATIGIEIDRLILKYSTLSPAKAVMLQAIGAERIEALCDAFCERPRFSPGYGDLPLETQREIFQVLDCSRQIGISLNDTLLMSPSKSVTAFVGIKEKGLGI